MNITVENGNFSYSKKKDNVSFLYKDDINFTLNQGEILTVLGPNGAGKTTLLKCVVGLLRWKKGKTLVDGVDLMTVSYKDLWRRIGYVPQAHKMVFGFTVEELVVMGRAPYISTLRQPSKEDRQKAMEALETVGIAHLAQKSCNEISGGERQLALIARTMVSNPELLILDEPESHLDVQKQIVILQILKRLAKEYGIACMINTHYPNHAFYLADQVLITAKDFPMFIGNVQEAITEERMRAYFGIELKKVTYSEANYCIETMIPKDLGIEPTCSVHCFRKTDSLASVNE